ncbi:TetR/AcrR family transcriptional regulator [Amycolatopsis endophytica]|uniref:AcrR family transcriptional regulator n=1 Tax=Amycolatopsis endophytica TaxID=860233 RepID=A0A853B9R4_9PSEU|nr:TetR/AcrR family transcriptional regulator [Amycolatopsis endophytica]NYI91431.1 AcrR family transcriptional regulator [Amycolatopsis endophytica]
MARTAARVTTLARQLTAERGLSGFTVEEVCERADISRRTFFNYFASKDDAVLGRSLHRDDDEHVAEFLARGASPTLLDDLATLTARRWADADMTIERWRDIHAAVEAEPRLLAKFVGHLFADQQSDVELVERREGLPPGDLRAAAAVQIVGALATSAVPAFLAEGNETSFADLLARRLDAARALLTTETERTP